MTMIIKGDIKTRSLIAGSIVSSQGFPAYPVEMGDLPPGIDGAWASSKLSPNRQSSIWWMKSSRVFRIGLNRAHGLTAYTCLRLSILVPFTKWRLKSLLWSA